MNITIDENMQSKIKKFLSGWKKTEDDEMFGLDDSIFWMDSAVNLLKEIVGEKEENDE